MAILNPIPGWPNKFSFGTLKLFSLVEIFLINTLSLAAYDVFANAMETIFATLQVSFAPRPKERANKTGINFMFFIS